MAADGIYQRSHGRIDRLEVDNFKSYRGHQYIGPFKSFTAVIGPNGSGKSNLMDAISFVLGVKTSQLRGSLKDLLYSDGGATQAARPRSGFVKLVYVLQESNAANGALEESELHFARVIVPTSSDPEAAFKSEYRIDGRTVSWEAYSSKLASLGILVKVRNFLVFQGDIEAVAAKSPQGLTTLFEQISGSEALRARFEEFVRVKAQADEKVTLLYTKRKQILAEVKAKKREKEDAEKHAKGLEELRALKSDLAVWQLVMEGRSLAEAVDDQRQAEEALTALQNKTQGHDSKVDALRRKAAGYKKEITLLEKKVKKLQMDKEKKSPALLKAKEELSRLVRSIRSGQKAVADKEKQVGEQERKLAQLQTVLKEVKEGEAALQVDIKAHYASHNRTQALDSEAMQQEYIQLKVRVGAETTRQESERKTLEAEQEVDRDKLAQLRTTMDQLRSRADQLAQQAEEVRARAEVAQADVAEARRSHAEKQKARQRLQEERTRSNSQRASLQLKQEELERALADIRMDRNQSRREREIAEMAERLKQQFLGTVYGKLVCLAKPIQSRYQLALSVAMQRDLDSVVVNNEATAKQCIQMLREEKKPQMNFLPLDFLKIRPINERLRQLGGTAKLALDLLNIPDRRMERAFHFALGDTVICEDEDEARRLAFGAQRLKVVTLQGTLISKRGTMTGGSAPPEARGARWDEGEVQRLKEELEGVLARLAELPSGRDLGDQEHALNTEMNALNSKINYGEAAVKESSGKAAGLLAQAQRAREEAERQEPQVEKLQRAMESREGKIQRLVTSINANTDRIMADFSRRAGVGSIREWEEQHAAFETSVSERRRELNNKRNQTQSQLEYETSHLAKLRTALAEVRQELEESSRRQEALEKEVAAAQGATSAVEGEVKELGQQLEGLREQVVGVDAEISDLQRAAADLGRRSAELRSAAAKAGCAVEERAGRMMDIVNGARLEQIKLPRKRQRDDEDEDGDTPMDETTNTEGGQYIDLDKLVVGVAHGTGGGGAGSSGEAGPSSADVGGTGAGAGGATQLSPAVLAASMQRLMEILDTSRLTRQQLSAQTARERERVRSELEAAITELQSQLDKAAPNMRAVEQYGAVREREKEQLAALHGAQAESAAASEEFNRIRGERHDLFAAAFKHISEQISAIYKDLTRSSTHPLGGQAYLHLENEEEPYAGGIKYTAIPPAKRFRDMEQLSGGEKTVAALALLFAIHSFRPSPFFVLDEVDAALDATNVARVAHYIRRRTRPPSLPEGQEAAEEEETPVGFQSIVISLKDIFYEKADSLVGVCRDLDAACSKTFTFDLSQFEEPLPDA